jgi:hypothetical protein
MAELINPNPVVYQRKDTSARTPVGRPGLTSVSCTAHGGPCAAPCSGPLLRPIWPAGRTQARVAALDEGEREPIDAPEVFEHIRDIADPEHPYSLEQLNVVETQLIDVDDARGRVKWAARLPPALLARRSTRQALLLAPPPPVLAGLRSRWPAAEVLTQRPPARPPARCPGSTSRPQWRTAAWPRS